MSTIPKIDFDESTHTYRVAGVVIPSATQIITGLAMVDFGAVPKHNLIEGRDRGREVHAICESFDKGILSIPSIDPRLVGYFKAYLQFCKDFNPEWLEIETMYYNQTWGYCMRLDRIGLIGKKIILLDLKTSQMKMPSHCIQTALYQKGWEENTGKKIHERWVLQLVEDGKYKIKEHKNNSDFSYALSAVMVYKWKVQNNMDYDIKANLEMFNF
jgi:hypothetical protein